MEASKVGEQRRHQFLSYLPTRYTDVARYKKQNGPLRATQKDVSFRRGTDEGRAGPNHDGESGKINLHCKKPSRAYYEKK